ncbi:MAG: TetR/AcrR family transcriptional regulator [Actinobacteria bacterium]|nr:TetR/AcrR family transcriptional regulator [Actinomycetota bacterium]
MAPGSDRAPLERERIIAEARDLIRVGGLESLSLRRLAARLGVTAAALYAHVTDKRDLLRGVAEIELAKLAEAYVQDPDMDPVQRLREQASAYIDHARAEPELFRVMFLFPPQLPDSNVPTESALPAATTAFALAHSAVVTAMRAGAIDCEDSLLTTFTLWAGIHGVATVLQLGFSLPPESEEQLRDEMIDRLLAGYGVR